MPIAVIASVWTRRVRRGIVEEHRGRALLLLILNPNPIIIYITSPLPSSCLFHPRLLTPLSTVTSRVLTLVKDMYIPQFSLHTSMSFPIPEPIVSTLGLGWTGHGSIIHCATGRKIRPITVVWPTLGATSGCPYRLGQIICMMHVARAFRITI